MQQHLFELIREKLCWEYLQADSFFISVSALMHTGLCRIYS